MIVVPFVSAGRGEAFGGSLIGDGGRDGLAGTDAGAEAGVLVGAEEVSVVVAGATVVVLHPASTKHAPSSRAFTTSSVPLTQIGVAPHADDTATAPGRSRAEGDWSLDGSTTLQSAIRCGVFQLGLRHPGVAVKGPLSEDADDLVFVLARQCKSGAQGCRLLSRRRVCRLAGEPFNQIRAAGLTGL
jgi:hypothetical protein